MKNRVTFHLACTPKNDTFARYRWHVFQLFGTMTQKHTSHNPFVLFALAYVCMCVCVHFPIPFIFHFYPFCNVIFHLPTPTHWHTRGKGLIYSLLRHSSGGGPRPWWKSFHPVFWWDSRDERQRRARERTCSKHQASPTSTNFCRTWVNAFSRAWAAPRVNWSWESCSNKNEGNSKMSFFYHAANKYRKRKCLEKFPQKSSF